jgi:hypothetical protein
MAVFLPKPNQTNAEDQRRHKDQDQQPQINQLSLPSCSGVGWVIPKKLINPGVT